MNASPKPEERDRQRWKREAEFFDAEEYDEGALPAATVERYLALRKPWLPAEFPFWALGDVKGKRVLEVGCGDGGNAIVLALKGAEVLGLDISPRAIGIARKRAAMHGLEGRAQFECAPLEVFVEQNRQNFDVICGFAVLHHLLPVLDGFLAQLKALARDDTRFLFVEPVSLWRWMRKVRLMLPIAVHGTPDERPLEPEDLAIIERHFPGLEARYFTALLRVVERALPTNYETGPAWRRGVYDLAARVDDLALNRMGLRGAAGSVVLYSR